MGEREGACDSQVDDAKGAEAYCLRHGVRHDKGSVGNENGLLLLLLKTYLHPEDER